MPTKKKFELRVLTKKNGYWWAVIYNIEEGYYKDQMFLYYTKSEVLHLLRTKYNCVCRAGSY